MDDKEYWCHTTGGQQKISYKHSHLFSSRHFGTQLADMLWKKKLNYIKHILFLQSRKKHKPLTKKNYC